MAATCALEPERLAQHSFVARIPSRSRVIGACVLARAAEISVAASVGAEPPSSLCQRPKPMRLTIGATGWAGARSTGVVSSTVASIAPASAAMVTT
ncbi:MAG: hypothetical protein JWM34_2114 [Ilumatobacteraceae bacterium]|nr:hypothetical protein [Ilumatobacteraceae bacterium]